MAQQNVGFDLVGPQAIDRSYGALAQGRNVPWTTVAAAVAGINVAFRYRGKTVMIDDGTTPGGVEYWWRVGTGDGQLVPKILREQSIEFIVGDGGAHTPAEGTTTYPGGSNPGTLINCKILGIGGDVGDLSSLVRTGGFQYYQYDPTSGLITLVNTQFNAPNWWKIKYIQL